MTPTIVVTGLGVVSPFGRGVGHLWAGLLRGENAFRELSVFDGAKHRTHHAGEVPHSEPSEDVAHLPPRTRQRMSRAEGFALEAAFEAVRSAGLDPAQLPGGTGVFFGSSAGGMFEGEQAYWDMSGRSGHAQRSGRSVRASRLGSQPNDSPGACVARTLRTGGPLETVASACAAATMAVESAVVSLRSGETTIALAGGADALCQLTYAGFNALRAVSGAPCLPFRTHREGLSLGEGAGVVVLETLAFARARGAHVLAEIAGVGSSCDAHHMTAPDPQGAGAALAITEALRDAGLVPADVHFVNAHGTGTPHNDASEWHALRSVFGERAYNLPVEAIKGSVGHLLGACGALELVATIRSLEESCLPPAPGTGPIDPECPADLVLGAPRRPDPCECALLVNFAFGGANAALIVRAPKGTA